MLRINLKSLNLAFEHAGTWNSYEPLDMDAIIEDGELTMASALLGSHIWLPSAIEVLNAATPSGVPLEKSSPRSKTLILPKGLYTSPEHKYRYTDVEGKSIYCDEKELHVDPAELQQYLETVLWLKGCDNPYVYGALQHKYIKEHFIYLQAMTTRECCRYSSLGRKWEMYGGAVPVDLVETTVGIAAYIDEELQDIEQVILDAGYDMLSGAVYKKFGAALIAAVGEDAFLTYPPTNKIEKTFKLNTNPRRVLFYLNGKAMPKAEAVVVQKKQHLDTKPAKEDEVVKPSEPVIEEATVDTTGPRFIFTVSDGTPLETGGCVQVEGGNNTYTMEEIINMLDETFDDYLEFADKFSDDYVGKLAKNQYYEKFSAPRVAKKQQFISGEIPLQLTIDPFTYNWTGVVWAPKFGSEQKLPVDKRPYNYKDKDVTMATASWTNIVVATINAFAVARDSLAALYYKTHTAPEDTDTFTGTIKFIDTETQKEACYSDGEWTFGELGRFTDGGIKSFLGFTLQVSGTGSILPNTFANILCSGAPAITELCKARAEMKDTIADHKGFNDYELYLTCIPTMRVPAHGMISGKDASSIYPVCLIDGKKIVIKAQDGWHNIIERKREVKSAGHLGSYKIGYMQGMIDWDSSLEKFINEIYSIALSGSADEVKVCENLACI